MQIRCGRATVTELIGFGSQTLYLPADRTGRVNPQEDIVATRAQAIARPYPVSIPFREILPWVVFAGVIFSLFIYFVGAEQGATAMFSGTWVHEFVHDGRHLLGFPCH